jgi:hypothetical protein
MGEEASLSPCSSMAVGIAFVLAVDLDQGEDVRLLYLSF